MRKLSLAWGLCALLAACGSDDDDEGSSSNGATGAAKGSVGDYCEAQCTRSEECGITKDYGITKKMCEQSCVKMSGSLRPCLLTDACIEGHRQHDCDAARELEPPKACSASCTK